jgi:hypothetical protein
MGARPRGSTDTTAGHPIRASERRRGCTAVRDPARIGNRSSPRNHAGLWGLLWGICTNEPHPALPCGTRKSSSSLHITRNPRPGSALITRRSGVRIPPPLPPKAYGRSSQDDRPYVLRGLGRRSDPRHHLGAGNRQPRALYGATRAPQRKQLCAWNLRSKPDVWTVFSARGRKGLSRVRPRPARARGRPSRGSLLQVSCSHRA